MGGQDYHVVSKRKYFILKTSFYFVYEKGGFCGRVAFSDVAINSDFIFCYSIRETNNGQLTGRYCVALAGWIIFEKGKIYFYCKKNSNTFSWNLT